MEITQNPTIPFTQPKTYADKARAVADDFESYFMFQAFELMGNTESLAGDDAVMGNSFAESMFKPMLHEQASNQITKAGGVGIADYIYTQLINLQETGL